MPDDENSSLPAWAAFDKDEEPRSRRRVSPTAVVVAALLVSGGVVAAGTLWPDPAPTRTAASQPSAGPTALPTATGTPAPTLSAAPPAPGDAAGAPGDATSPSVSGTSPSADGAAPAPPPDEGQAGQGSAAPGQPAAPPAPAPAPAPRAPAPRAPVVPAPPVPAAPASPATGLLGAVTATVPATSPNAVDGAGRPVGYAASNLLDGNPSTAWRADGDLTGQVLTFTFDTPREISRAGLVNGYAKVDPATHADRYVQSRRITQVTWTVGGQQVVQLLDGHDPHPQTTTFPPVTVQSLTMRIDAVTAPGHPRFDQTVISDVVLADG